MSDFIAGRAAGAREGGSGAWNGGSPPPVLLVALGVATLIAVTLSALLMAGGGGDDGSAAPEPARGAATTTPATSDRALLSVSIEGDGKGQVDIAPIGLTCSDPCEHDFATGMRVTITADAARGSTFAGWGGACDGDGRCAFVMDSARSLTVTFEESRPTPAPAPAPPPLCDDGDPACAQTDPEEFDDAPAPASDCHDGRDNDADGLTDAAQDPDCAGGRAEAGRATAPPRTTTTPAPPPAAAVNECADRRDNDGDGLTDTAQDPGCESGRSEGGTATAPTRAPNECADGRDNDGDGLIDTAQDPGCEANRTEA